VFIYAHDHETKRSSISVPTSKPYCKSQAGQTIHTVPPKALQQHHHHHHDRFTKPYLQSYVSCKTMAANKHSISLSWMMHAFNNKRDMKKLYCGIAVGCLDDAIQ